MTRELTLAELLCSAILIVLVLLIIYGTDEGAHPDALSIQMPLPAIAKEQQFVSEKSSGARELVAQSRLEVQSIAMDIRTQVLIQIHRHEAAPDDDKAAIILALREGAERGDAEARFNLAHYLVDQGLTPETEREAAKWLRKIVADQQEEFVLPAFMLMGEIRKSLRREYPSVSDEELESASGSIGVALANRGEMDGGIDAAIREASLLFAPSQLWLAITYTYDTTGRRFDERVLKYFREMAAERLPRGMLFFGLTLVGGWGVSPNVIEGVGWIRLAAKSGLPDAQHYMGVANLEGIGDPKDDQMAVRWFKLAADQDHEASRLRLISLKDREGESSGWEAVVRLMQNIPISK